MVTLYDALLRLSEIERVSPCEDGLMTDPRGEYISIFDVTDLIHYIYQDDIQAYLDTRIKQLEQVHD